LGKVWWDFPWNPKSGNKKNRRKKEKPRKMRSADLPKKEIIDDLDHDLDYDLGGSHQIII